MRLKISPNVGTPGFIYFLKRFLIPALCVCVFMYMYSNFPDPQSEFLHLCPFIDCFLKNLLFFNLSFYKLLFSVVLCVFCISLHKITPAPTSGKSSYSTSFVQRPWRKKNIIYLSFTMERSNFCLISSGNSNWHLIQCILSAMCFPCLDKCGLVRTCWPYRNEWNNAGWKSWAGNWKEGSKLVSNVCEMCHWRKHLASRRKTLVQNRIVF